MEQSSIATHTTHVISHESLECVEPVNHKTPNFVPPSAEKSADCISSLAINEESDVPLSSLHLDLQVPPKSVKPGHKRTKTNELLMEYLQGDGAAENRAMVSIESISIEDVYDGVHDGEVLGVGITGDVRLITRKDTGTQRALKRLDLSDLKDKDDLHRLLEEVKIMCALDHPHIVCLEEVYEGESELYLTQELCTGGDLFDRLEEQTNESYTEEQCARLIRQIISSVSYLHSKNIIHRDLKLENFLFQDESNDSELKMIDFGLSKHFNVGELQHDMVGTPYTVAPEVLVSKDGYNEKVDVWAIGVITYLLLSGDTPFGGACANEDLRDVREKILSGQVTFEEEVWERVSDFAISFIKSILVVDPQMRPSVEELLKHPWMVTMKRSSSISDEEMMPLDSKVVSGLVNFKEMSTATKFLCEVLSFTLQPEQLRLLRLEFEKLDSSGKGEITLDDFKIALLEKSDIFPMTDQEVEEIFNGLHVRQNDMSIRWHEFIAACLSQCQIDDKNIRLAFNRIDSEHKGYVTLDNLKNIMDFYGTDKGGLQQLWINEILDYKSNKDHMTYDDFYKLLKLDRHEQNLSKSMPVCDDLTLSLPDIHVMPRRHSAIDMNPIESPVVSTVKTYRKLQSVILDASKYAGGNNTIPSRPRRKASLILSRSAQKDELILLSKSLDTMAYQDIPLA